MAIFHTSIKTFSRGKGQSAVAAAAYRGGLLLMDLLTGQQHDYRRRSGVVESFCLAPPDAPQWALDPRELWAVAEAAERRKDSTVAREFEVSLPHELSEEQRAHLAFVIADALVDRYGFAVQASIHSPGTPDGLNHHVHILATTRRLGPEGFGDKTRELDVGPSGKVQVQWIREMVAATTNAHLEAAGLTSTIDHRSLVEQARSAMERGDDLAAAALSREPTQHLGKRAAALAGKGVATDRVCTNEEIAQDNQEHFEYLVRKAGLEGKPAPLPGQEAAKRSGRVLNAETAGLPGGLEMRGVSGVRLHNLLLSCHGHTPEPTPISLAEKILDALRDVEEISRARADLAMEKVRDALRWAQRQLSSQEESSELRQWITEAVVQIRAIKHLIIGRARRLLNVKSATRLRHMAEQEWERFNADCPPGSTRYSRSEWTLRRGRRLSVLEKHTAELKVAQERASEGELKAIDAEILMRAELLAALPHPSQAAAPKFAEPKQVASSVLGSVPSVSRGPTFH